MQTIFLFSMIVNGAIGAALLLSGRYDRSQPIARWIGLSFLINVLWVPGFLIFYHVEPIKWVGAALWAGQGALSLQCLIVGVMLLRGTKYALMRRSALTAALFVALLISTVIGEHLGAAMNALLFSIVAFFVARLLLRGKSAEKLAGLFLIGNALAWWITPILGLERFALQVQIVTCLRLFLGLALLHACLNRTADEVKRVNDQFLRLTEGAHQGVVIVQEQQIKYANPQALRLFEFSECSKVPPEWSQWGLDAAGRLVIEAKIANLQRGDLESVTWYQTWRHKDSTDIRLHMSGWLIDWQEKPAVQVVFSDETELHQAEQRLIYTATHDRLTGLLNRLGIEQRAMAILRDRITHALLLINIDRFSTVNDAFGYVSGDQLLKLVSERIQSISGPIAPLARTSRDEYVLLLPVDDRSESLSQVSNALLEAVRLPYPLDGISLNITASIGVAIYPVDADNFERLLAQASLAVKQAKEAGHNTVRHFDNSMDKRLLDEMQLVNDLHGAVQRKEFELFLQPIMDMHTQTVTGAEALIRWNHPAQGLVSPGLFIPVAEKSGLIIEIGGWIIDEACRLLGSWQSLSEFNHLTLSINVSAKQFGRGDVDQVVADALRKHRTPAHLLELEITESALINDPEKFVDLLRRLRSLGVRLAIDDFGTGYSNLSYLHRFQVDKLKVDQSFVRDLTGSSQNTAIVRAVIQLATSLGLKTTAEGIESAEVFEALHRLGCDQAQGYHFAPPLPQASFERWCKQWISSKTADLSYPSA